MRLALLSDEQRAVVTSLLVQGNGLLRLPVKAIIANLPYLEVLDASNNNLAFIPPLLGRCVRLQWLMLRNNQLHSVPSSLSELKHLRLLALKPNPALPTFLNVEIQGIHKVQRELDHIARLVGPLEKKCLDSVRYWLCIWRFGVSADEGVNFHHLDRPIAKLVARFVWETRSISDVWGRCLDTDLRSQHELRNAF